MRDADDLADLIRKVDPNHQLSAAAIAAHLVAAGVILPDPGEQRVIARQATLSGNRVARLIREQAGLLRTVAADLDRLAAKASSLTDGTAEGNATYTAIARDAQQAVLHRVVGNTDLTALTESAGEADECRILAAQHAPKED